MPKGQFMQNSFNAGEWSSLMDGRTDLEKYSKALKQMENCVIDPRGPAIFRPGFRYIAGTKTNSTVSRVIPFEFSATTAYVLEFGNLYIRIFKDQAQVESSGSPVEIVTTYAAADLSGIKYCQSADILYLFHPDYAPRKLSRASDTDWTLTTINFSPAPTYEAPVYPSTTLTLSALTGTNITATAGAATFLAGDVGRTIRVGAGKASIISFTSTTVVVCDVIDDFSSVGPIASGDWSLNGSPVGSIFPSIAAPVGAIATITAQGSEAQTNLLDDGSNLWTVSVSGTGEYYLINTAPFYSAVKPSKIYLNQIERTEGTMGSLAANQWDFGDNDTLGYSTIYVRLGDDADPDTKAASDESYVMKGVVTDALDLFRSTNVGSYIRILSGFVKITSFTSATVVKGEILKELTSAIATSNWTLESDMWTSANGYPSSGNFFEDRLFLAGSTAFPETVWGSVTGDYENHTPGIDDADSIQFTLAGRQVSIIRWIEPREYLIIGCVGGEWRVGPDDQGTALTPLNVTAKLQTTYGCDDILPVTADKATLFVQRSSRKLREFSFQWETDGYVAPDLTLLAEHITDGNIIDIAYQQSPLSILWCVRGDGKLLGMTYMRDQDVVGWHLHETDGSIESVCTIPGDGYDELWMIVNRTINGNTVRYVEMMEAYFVDSNATYKSNKGLNAFFVDSGITYNGAAATTITGLSHLEGESVAVLADGSNVTGKTVSGGQITLGTAASIVHVGLQYTAKLRNMRFDTQLQEGTAQSRKKKIVSMNLRVYETASFKYGRDEDNLKPVTAQELGLGGLVLGAIKDLSTEDIEVISNSAWDKEGHMTIVQDAPMPFTLIAIIARASIES